MSQKHIQSAKKRWKATPLDAKRSNTEKARKKRWRNVSLIERTKHAFKMVNARKKLLHGG